MFSDSSPEAEFIPELQPQEDELVLDKLGSSAFSGTDLDQRLEEILTGNSSFFVDSL